MLRSGKIFETYSGNNRCNTIRQFTGESLALKRNDLYIQEEEANEPTQVVNAYYLGAENYTLLRQIRLLLLFILVLKVICIVKK